MICLANSVKLGGRCVAGLRRDGAGWVRPVSSLPDGTLTSRHYLLDNRKPAGLLDVVRLSLNEPKPEVYQPENWVLEDTPWRLIGTLSTNQANTILCSALDNGPLLLGNASDRLSIDQLGDRPVSASLALIEPEDLSWEVTTNIKGHRQTRALFKFSGNWYCLAVTDPLWRVRLGGLALGTYSRNECQLTSSDKILFTVSLGKPMANGKCFKLVAGVIVLPS